MGRMNTETTPEQLTLLPQADVPVRFRLDEATRRRGLEHVAEIRRMLAASATRTQAGGRAAAPSVTVGRPAAVPGSRRAA
jgi:hypothetical protein